ncbi:hypothetical protein M2138_000268 [Dysgonomonadaceae bacterium PH5-43]|nr:hypothetical protein [Dysgonomonadaceae bacterium PH5-43]
MEELKKNTGNFGRNANDSQFVEALIKKGYDVFERPYWQNGNVHYECWCITLVSKAALNPYRNYEDGDDESNRLIWLETVNLNGDIRSKLQYEVISELKEKITFFELKEDEIREFLEKDKPVHIFDV